MRRVLPALAGTVAALVLAGCGSGSPAATPGESSGSGTLVVSAAASLTEAFTAIGDRFMADHPGSRVTFNFGPSSGLAEQIVQGAPVDVFASASTATMDTVVSAGEASDPTVLAHNSLEVATPPDDPAGVSSLSDLAKPAVKVAVCQPEVPCGAAAAALFAQNHLTVTPVTAEVDVKSVLAKVEAGEVDAGVVYVTDVKAAGSEVRGVVIPPADNVTTAYPIAVLKGSTHPALARAFVAAVLSASGQEALRAAGFSVG